MSDEIMKGNRPVDEISELHHRISELEKSELEHKKLREEFELLRFTFDQASDAIVLITSDGYFYKMNDVMCRYSGYSKEELTSMKVSDVDQFLPEEKWSDIRYKIKIEGRTAFETSLQRKDGSSFPVEIRAAFLEVNGTEYYSAIVRDVTKRRHSEEALKDSEQRYRTLYNYMRDAFVVTDLDGRILECNESYMSMVGYKFEELKQMRYRDLTPARWHDYEKKIIEEQVLQHGNSVLYEKEYIRKDGTLFPVELKTFLIRDKSGKPAGFSAIVRDITERKLAEEALRERDEHFRFLVENAPEAIFVEAEGRFVYLNRIALKLFGAESPEQLHGKPILDRMHPDYRAVIRERIRITNEEKKAVPQMEEIYLKLDGTPFNVEVSAIPYRFDNHDGAIVFSHDITERKLLEAAHRMSEAKYRTLFESANDSIFLIRDNKFIDCNIKTLEMFRCTRDQIIGQTPYRFSPHLQPDGRDSEEGTLELLGAAAGGKAQFFEWKHCTYDGSLFDAEVSLNSIDLYGETIIQAIVRDISDRKRVEEQLARLTREQEIILETAPVGISLVADRKQVWVNRKTEELLRYSREEMKNRTTRNLYPTQEAYEELAKSAYPVLARGNSFETVQELICGDGSHILVRYNGRAIDPADFTKGIIWILEDVTERKRAEEERERLISELQKALSEVKKLSGMLPICASCKKIRNDKGYWEQIEGYIRDRSEAEFTHGICPDCAKKLYAKYYKKD